jgi:hypothetical protein
MSIYLRFGPCEQLHYRYLWYLFDEFTFPAGAIVHFPPGL